MSHKCAKQTCGHQLLDDDPGLACREHWYKVPAELRQRFIAASRTGDGSGYLLAEHDILAALRVMP